MHEPSRVDLDPFPVSEPDYFQPDPSQSIFLMEQTNDVAPRRLKRTSQSLDSIGSLSIFSAAGEESDYFENGWSCMSPAKAGVEPSEQPLNNEPTFSQTMQPLGPGHGWSDESLCPKPYEALNTMGVYVQDTQTTDGNPQSRNYRGGNSSRKVGQPPYPMEYPTYLNQQESDISSEVPSVFQRIGGPADKSAQGSWHNNESKAKTYPRSSEGIKYETDDASRYVFKPPRNNPENSMHGNENSSYATETRYGAGQRYGDIFYEGYPPNVPGIRNTLGNARNGTEDSKRRIVEKPRIKLHKCPVCLKNFKRPSSFRIHFTTHTGIKSFKCNWEGCGKKFNVKSNMTRHQKLHLKRK